VQPNFPEFFFKLISKFIALSMTKLFNIQWSKLCETTSMHLILLKGFQWYQEHDKGALWFVGPQHDKTKQTKPPSLIGGGCEYYTTCTTIKHTH
jgi:hypothetical protein